MARSSSPLPVRHSNALPRTPSLKRDTITIDDEDELAGDTIPCSPSAFFRDRDTTTTQPTQILSRPTFNAMRSSSPPSSVIEVPASSPFQAQPKRPTALGSRLAPAGTVFRPPARPQPTSGSKRSAAEPIDLISDDEDDLTPPRGDIRPTMFRAHVSAFAYNPEAEQSKSTVEDKEKTREKLRQIFHIFGTKYPAERVREALKVCKNDTEDACNWLEDNHASPIAKSMQPSKPKGRRLVTKGSLQASATSSRAQSLSASPSPQKQQPRRRLVQGLRRPAAPSSPEVIAAHPSSEDPLVIDLVDNDEGDAYQAEQSPSSDEDENDRVLTCINTSTVKELAAMTSLKEAQLEPMIERRPFKDLGKARRVTVDKKPGARKAAKISIGETVVDAVEVFMNAVSAIDKVVAKCETKAQAVREQMETWDLDTFGHKKGSRSGEDSLDDLPPTPTSFTSTKYRRPPIPQQPSHMDGHCQMKPFQVFGLNWMSLLYKFEMGCILADEMGLGKTCQVISLMSHLVEQYEENPSQERPWPNLIVVPPSTYSNWLAEFERFSPGLSVVGYRGSQAERAEIAYAIEQDPQDYHVVLATYSQINSEADIEAMQSFDLNAAIFDEGHKMKNPQTKIYKDLSRIPAQWKMLLTGTPVQNNLLEMTSLLNFINPEIFRGCMEHIEYIFSQKVSIRDISNGAFLYSERVRRARTILEPFILQRRKDQVLSDMPQKICRVVYCDMTESQRVTYEEYEEIFKREPSQRSGQGRGRANDMNNIWIQLRKAALHPLLFRRYFGDAKVEKMGKILMENLDQSELHQPDIKHLVQELKNSSDFELHLWCRDYPPLLKKFDIPEAAELDSGKILKLLELIAQYKESGDRVLVFSKFSRVIELLREVLAMEGVEHRVLMGNTNVGERQDLINEFNEDPEIPVFLLTTGAGGTGINLTAANKVVIFDQSDNPQDDIQAENRAHRLGQKRDVEIIRLIAKGTIEELIYKACQKKIELANKVTGAVEEVAEDAQEIGRNLEQEVRKMLEKQTEEEQMTPP